MPGALLGALALSFCCAPGAAAAPVRSGIEADNNGDGYLDLAVGAPNAKVGSREHAGAVVVLYGSASGVSGGRRTVVHQDSPGVPGTAERNDRFGRSLASADLDGDGYSDLVVGSPSETVGSVPYRGSVTVLWGGRQGIAGGASLPLPSDLDEESVMGTGVAAGDFNGDGYGDLVVGDALDPGGDRTRGHKGGQLTVWYGGPTGPAPAQRPTVVHQDTPGVPGSGESADGFGVSVAVGDIDKDGYADVAVGAPYEDLNGSAEAGAVTVLYGSKGGLTTARARMITQDTAGVPGSPERYDYFGHALTLRDLTGDGRSDLVIGAPEENSYGMVTVLRGAASALSTSGVVSITGTAAGLSGASQEWFGMVLPDAARSRPAT
ncbi:FG-GAP-like repeat-containing protein [Streptomyces chryseus]|uniref:FG-GAP-like repeat-containing protein n=1 Tax=Streptomyces chryseus TaxID=68186 RepID=UPI001E562B7B|nr:FG-GAP-like repeat-containing protein [Streptomyces chryseus]